jgi:hypothetical protein
MGAWGVGTFENDAAADWLADLPQTLGLTFRPVVAIEPDLYLEEPEASEALAAAEVVAAMRGHPGEAMANRPEVGEWAQEHSDWLQPHVERDALAAVDRIRSSSELHDLWAETEEYEGWLAVVSDLRDRLQA